MKTGPMTYYEMLDEHLAWASHEERMVAAARVILQAVALGDQRGKPARVGRGTLLEAVRLLNGAARRLEAGA